MVDGKLTTAIEVCRAACLATPHCTAIDTFVLQAELPTMVCEMRNCGDAEWPEASGTRPEPFNSTPMGVNSILSGSPHVRPMGRTCGEPDEIKKNTHPKYFTALFREQGRLAPRAWLRTGWNVSETCSSRARARREGNSL